MIIAIHQPNFLPWIGYFHKIKEVSKYVFLDDVQFSRGKTFTSRTKILINGKESWLTIPVLGKSDMPLIKDVRVDNNSKWKRKHLGTLKLNYKKANFLNDILPMIEEVYKTNSDYLIDYNIPLIVRLAEYLELSVEFIRSSELLPESRESGLEKIIEINKSLKVDSYLSGLGKGSGRHVDEERFKKENINLIWQEFNHPIYPQLSADFVPNLSIIDLLFNCGPRSRDYL